MAEVLLRYAAAFAETDEAGKPNEPLILETAADTADGLLLGDAESGTGGTGITYSTQPRTRAKPKDPGSVTESDPFYVTTDVQTFSMVSPFGGNRAPRPATPTGPEWQPFPGMDALLQASGLLRGAGSATEIVYSLGHALSMNGIVWDGTNDPVGTSSRLGARSIVQDALVTTLAIEYASGEVPIATSSILGAVTPEGTLGSGGGTPFVRNFAFPTTDYGLQATVPPVLTAGVNGLWDSPDGVGGPYNTERCFQTLTVTVDSAVSDSQDSCAIDGFARRATLPLAVTMAGTFIVNDEDFDAEWDAMTLAMEASASYTFQVGATAAGSGDPMEAHAVLLDGIRVTSFDTVEIDETGLRGIAMSASCTGATPLAITFL